MVVLRSSFFAFLCFAVLAGCGSEETQSGGSGGVGGSGGSGGAGATGGTGGCAPCDQDGAEIADNGCDDNCSGTIDEKITCDSTLTIDGDLPVDGARAIDVCKPAESELDWGVTRVDYTLPGGEDPPAAQMDAFALGHGLLDGFGSTSPRGGLHMLALSSGTARDVDDPGYQSTAGFDKGYASGQPSGFSPDVPACPGTTPAGPRDGIALSLELRVPPNASAFAFDFAFFTRDFPDVVCSEFSDLFAVLLASAPADRNLTFDEAGNPIGVHSAFLEACGCDGGPPCDAGGLTFDCPLGEMILLSTGYEGAGATGWLTTVVPTVSGSEIQLTFAIWDSGDAVFDSTVLIDNFRWVEHEGDVMTRRSEGRQR